ncbi:zinc finger CCCH domain-containing protein 46 [Ananas comosus]|uniref:Zinc finger CCCH domain-containing protein 46 n=1 Tax=Ananas comosus TaxID=4615 RepID=A0A6P5EXG8_ANACO|nr:zinc finger CCCH domain-containing protein 46 [Ananas comosus]XP_020088208.1 zinc finger CCCH domain-containing protein 46 [Ananas comosus]
MNRRQEPCRNFLRGSCKYGAQCKFLHVSPQQSKSNSFGFGTQSTSQSIQTSQQQKPNPYGFGVQNNSQLKGASDFGARNQSLAKPFENKWTRSSSVAPSKQTDTQPQAPVHICTDPESCKRQIAEDFKNEAPIWKLTCYSHGKNGPCDILGDISFEELRAVAYEDARQGCSLQSIVERERNLLNSKLLDFDNLLRNPYVLQKSGVPMVGPSPGTNSVAPFGASQSNAPPVFSSFSQLGAVTNAGSSFRASAPGTPSNTVFGQSNSFQNPSQNTTFGQLSSSQNSSPNNIFGQSNSFQNTSQSTNFGQSNSFLNTSQASAGFEMKFGPPVAFGSQLASQPFGSSPGIGMSNFSAGDFKATNNQFFPQPGSSSSQSKSFDDWLKVPSDSANQSSNEDTHSESIDASIWLKKEWSIGEIPEEEPPQRFCT